MVAPLSLSEVVRLHVAARIDVAVDPRERASIEEVLAELDRLPSPFDEHADPVHLTASAVVVSHRGVVLHRHKRLGIWLQPGGHIDPGEAPWDAALREAAEETGLPVRWPAQPGLQPLLHVDVHDGGRGHRHLDLRYLVRAEPVDPEPGEGESQDVRWFDWGSARAIADPGLSGLLATLDPA